jgi:DNA-binding transcriptional ArsR family regulator
MTVTNASVAAIAALVGDPARLAMMQALMDGRALTAAELAGVAGVTPQTASGHLGQLTAAGLLAVEKQGRHRYHRLAGAPVARMLEGLMQVAAETAPAPARRIATGPRDAALRTARTCYDHIAGRLGVALADALTGKGYVELAEDGGLVTERGHAFLRELGVSGDEAAATSRARPFCRPCLDWSERRPHLAGRLGAALCAHCLAAGWVRRREGSRALDITPPGRQALHRFFAIDGAALTAA